MSLINNPPHLLNKKGEKMPSALIPFCTFGSIIKGKAMPNFSFPICDMFDPVSHDGKLCYQTDMAKKMAKESTVQGNGLTLIIDANIEKSVAHQIELDRKNNNKSMDLREAASETTNLVGVNIGTLAPFHAFGPGNYILTAMKQMSATDDFLSLSKEKRTCEKEKIEDCQQRLFLESMKQCGCTPQALIPALRDRNKAEFIRKNK